MSISKYPSENYKKYVTIKLPDQIKAYLPNSVSASPAPENFQKFMKKRNSSIRQSADFATLGLKKPSFDISCYKSTID